MSGSHTGISGWEPRFSFQSQLPSLHTLGELDCDPGTWLGPAQTQSWDFGCEPIRMGDLFLCWSGTKGKGGDVASASEARWKLWDEAQGSLQSGEGTKDRQGKGQSACASCVHWEWEGSTPPAVPSTTWAANYRIRVSCSQFSHACVRSVC